MSVLDVVNPDGSTSALPVIHASPRGTYAVVDLRGSAHKGVVDVFHTGTGKRATPPRHFAAIGKRAVSIRLADWLDELDPVDDEGALRIDRAEYHSRFDDFVKALTA